MQSLSALWRRAQLAVALLLLFVPHFLSCQEITTTDPYKVKAAFLSKFVRYVTWPKEALPQAGAPWKIGILGDDPFGDTLERTLKGRTEQQCPFQVVRAAKLADLPSCHIVFVALKEPDSRRTALLALSLKPVLTVGDDPEFLNEKGIIRFRLTETLLIDINLDQAQAAKLGIQTKMLEIAGGVLEKGKLRLIR